MFHIFQWNVYFYIKNSSRLHKEVCSFLLWEIRNFLYIFRCMYVFVWRVIKNFPRIFVSNEKKYLRKFIFNILSNIIMCFLMKLSFTFKILFRLHKFYEEKEKKYNFRWSQNVTNFYTLVSSRPNSCHFYYGYTT